MYARYAGSGASKSHARLHVFRMRSACVRRPSEPPHAVSLVGGERNLHLHVVSHAFCMRSAPIRAITCCFACGRPHETFSYTLCSFAGGHAHEAHSYILFRMRSTCVRRPQSKPSHSDSLVGARMKPSATFCFACALHMFRRPQSKPSHAVSLVGARMKPSVTCCLACVLHASGAHNPNHRSQFRWWARA